jgi:ribosome biogenesis protein NSA2
VPLPKVRGIAEEEMFKVVKTGKKTAKKGWKRMITKPTFVVSQIPIEKKLCCFT